MRNNQELERENDKTYGSAVRRTQQQQQNRGFRGMSMIRTITLLTLHYLIDDSDFKEADKFLVKLLIDAR